MRTRFIGIAALAALGTLANADIVLNQLDFNQASQYVTAASQDFSPVNNGFDVIAIDDFTVNANQTRLTQIEAIMAGFPQTGFVFADFTNGSITGYRVEVYTSLAAAGSSMVGNAGSMTVASASVSAVNLGWAFPYALAGHITVPINIVLPGPGTYWIGIAPTMDESVHGQVGVNATSLALGNQNGNLANAAGGWGWSGNIFGGIPDPSSNPVAKDLEYRLTATAVPEPGSMIALGLGVTALLARRRRKVA